MSRYTLNWNDYSSPKKRAISFNNLFEKMLEENPRMNSYTLVLFYEDRTPMRIFDNRMPNASTEEINAFSKSIEKMITDKPNTPEKYKKDLYSAFAHDYKSRMK